MGDAGRHPSGGHLLAGGRHGLSGRVGATLSSRRSADVRDLTAQARPAEDAFRTALSEMLLWLEEEYNFARKDAFMFLAQVLEARITQFVNPTFSYVAKVKKEYLEWTK